MFISSLARSLQHGEPDSPFTFHRAGFKKFSWFSTSTSFTSKSEVICLMTSLGVQTTGKKIAWVQIFTRVELEWNEWMWHFSCSLCLCSVKSSDKHKSAVFGWNLGCFGCTPSAQLFLGQIRYFRHIKNNAWHRYSLNAALCDSTIVGDQGTVDEWTTNAWYDCRW